MKRPGRALLAAAFTAAASGICARENPYAPPLFWSVYEYHIVRQQQAGNPPVGHDTTENYIPESELRANIDWVDSNLKPYGYNMIAIDGWGDATRLNQNGYRTTHSKYWEHDYAYWSRYLRSRGLRLGMYETPLFIHVQPDDVTTKIVGTDIPVSSLIDRNEHGVFTWVQVNRPGAEQYVKGYIKYFADMGIDYLRLDFLSWYENGRDRYLGHVGADRPREDYAKALRWMREAADQYGVYLSYAMPHLFNEAELERRYAHNFRVSEDVDYGEWWKFSDKYRGQRYSAWSQYSNSFDGFTYWSCLSGRDRVRLDGDFIRMNTFATDSEKRTVMSAHLVAGGPIAVADRYNTIGDSLWVYQNKEMLQLNSDELVGKPLTNDPTDERSQIWHGRLSNGDVIVALFNRESTVRTRDVAFGKIGVSGTPAVRDLWQHAPLGAMKGISVQLAPHASMVLRLSNAASPCRPQTIAFDPIPEKHAGDAPPRLAAHASSGRPVKFEVSLGPAKIQGQTLQPTGPGEIYVTAYESGDGTYCAAIPVVQSFGRQ